MFVRYFLNGCWVPRAVQRDTKFRRTMGYIRPRAKSMGTQEFSLRKMLMVGFITPATLVWSLTSQPFQTDDRLSHLLGWFRQKTVSHVIHPFAIFIPEKGMRNKSCFDNQISIIGLHLSICTIVSYQRWCFSLSLSPEHRIWIAFPEVLME